MTLLLYYLGGVGVRERSRYAAAVVFLMYLLDTLVSPGVVRVLLSALLLSNLRATWIAANWSPDSEEAALPPRLRGNLGRQVCRPLSTVALAEGADFVLCVFRRFLAGCDIRLGDDLGDRF